MNLLFVKPSMQYMFSFIETLKEGPFTHMAMGNFGDWPVEEVERAPEAYLEHVNNTAPREVTTPNSQTFTFTDHYIKWAVDENDRFIAGISFRFDDNALINTYCGHAGMSVRPSLLYKGYGVKAALGLLDFMIEEANKRKMSHLLASADPTNPASFRILEHVGGVLIKEHDPYGWGVTKLYKLTL